MDSKRPIIVIAGPTASGKTEMSIKLAEEFNGEIICADSRTIYKDMNIGTAKPGDEQRRAVLHHGLDLIRPNEKFSAAQFKECAQQKMAEIQSRGKIPFIVGGSGLYIDSLVYDFQFSTMNAKRDPVNSRHLAKSEPRSRRKFPTNVLYLCLRDKKEMRDKKIEKRVGEMIKAGLLNETEKLLASFGPDAPGLLAPGYKAMAEHIIGNISFDEAKKQFIQADKNLAKRQITWFKRNPDIHWVRNFTEAKRLVASFVP